MQNNSAPKKMQRPILMLTAKGQEIDKVVDWTRR